MIGKVIADGASRGEFRADVEADTLARLIVSGLAGAHLQAKYSKGVTLNALLVELREAVLLRATIRRIGTPKRRYPSPPSPGHRGEGIMIQLPRLKGTRDVPLKKLSPSP